MTSRRRTARRGALLAGLIAVGAIGAACTPSGSNVEIRTIIRTFRDAGFEPDPSMIPILHWQGGLFGRGTQNLVLRNQLAKALADLDRELQVVG